MLASIQRKIPLYLYLQVGKAVSVKAEQGQWVDLGIPTSCISSPAKCDYNGSTIAFWMRNSNLSEGGILSSHEAMNYSFILRNVYPDKVLNHEYVSFTFLKVSVGTRPFWGH